MAPPSVLVWQKEVSATSDRVARAVAEWSAGGSTFILDDLDQSRATGTATS